MSTTAKADTLAYSQTGRLRTVWAKVFMMRRLT